MPITEYMNMTVDGNMAEAVIKVYTDLIGDWFWVWFIGLSLLMLYSRTRDYATVGVVGLTVLVHVFPVLPLEVHLFVYVLLTMAIANILYKLYSSK